MRKNIYSAALAAMLLVATNANAQEQIFERKTIPTTKGIVSVINSDFTTVYLGADSKLYTLRSVPVLSSSNIQKAAINPAKSSFAIIYKKSDEVKIYSANEQNFLLKEITDKRKKLPAKPYPVTLCYGADARSLVISNTLGEIIIFDTKEYLPQAYINNEGIANTMAVSSNNYFIAAGTGSDVIIWNFQTHKMRTRIPMGIDVREVVFSPDASSLAVITADNKLTTFDTKTWKETRIYKELGTNLSKVSFHPDGKYLSIVDNKNQIVVVNCITGRIETKINNDPTNNVVANNFFKNNSSNEIFILSNRNGQIIFWDATKLAPYFTKDLTKAVDAKMADWIKMLDGETADAYAIRVNDETRQQQQLLFAQEVATKMAGDRISVENPFIGTFDASAGMLNIGFEHMQGIQLSMSAEEASKFGDAKDLKFENITYILNENDEFEVAYVEVRNEITNKVYIYDNIGRLKLQQLEHEIDFVPLEIMQQASQEEIKLVAIKEQVVEENKDESLISDHTIINVKTTVIPDVNADGQKILNYKIGYQYEVINKEYSAKDDFPAGQFITEKSNAAMSLMKIIKQAFEGDFAKYLEEGKEVKIIITGSADASRILNTKPYDERYGKYVDEPFYKDGNLSNITVTKESGISTNEQLALMRAAGVHHYIVNNINTLKNTKNSYEYHVEVAKEKGGEFRRINVEFVIVDAFPQK